MHGATSAWPIGTTKEKLKDWERKLISLGTVETKEMTIHERSLERAPVASSIWMRDEFF
jgi:hypothetical protein